MLLHLFQKRAPLFALSTDPQSRGALNLKTDDAKWRSVLNDMLPRAGLILMIPASSGGVLEEMKILEREGWFDKTLFIAPPENDANTMGTAWEAMRLRPEFRHLEIPPYCDAGFLFRLDRGGMLAEAGPLGIDRSPAPLVPFEKPFEGKGDPDTDDIDSGIDEGDGTGGWQNGDGLVDGGAAAASSASVPTPASAQTSSTASVSSSTSLATSSAQFANLSLMMQSVPQLTVEQFATLSGADADGGDGGDGGGFDGGGGG